MDRLRTYPLRPIAALALLIGLVLTGCVSKEPEFASVDEAVRAVLTPEPNEEREMKALAWLEKQGIDEVELCRLGLQTEDYDTVFNAVSRIRKVNRPAAPLVPDMRRALHLQLQKGRDDVPLEFIEEVAGDLSRTELIAEYIANLEGEAYEQCGALAVEIDHALRATLHSKPERLAFWENVMLEEGNEAYYAYWILYREYRIREVVERILAGDDLDKIWRMTDVLKVTDCDRGDFAPELKDQLTSEEKSRRKWAAQALGWYGELAKPAVEDLIGLLDDEFMDVRIAAHNALKKIDPDLAERHTVLDAPYPAEAIPAEPAG